MGIFLKQLPQILLMAFPAMITASLLTAACLYSLAPASWSFWVRRHATRSALFP